MAYNNRISNEKITKPVARMPKPVVTERASPQPISTSVDSLQRVTTHPNNLSHADFFQLQRTVGNRAVQRLVSSDSTSLNEMPVALQIKMESAFNSDFSKVRLYPNSGQVAKVSAKAMTQGNEIHFAPGAYNPGNINGQRLLGHELAHVVQQRQGRVHPTMCIGGEDINDSAALEREADQSGTLAAHGGHAAIGGDRTATSGTPPVQQYFFEISTVLSMAAGLGLSAMSIMGLVSAFGVIAVGYAITRCMNRGNKKLSYEELNAELLESQKKTGDHDDKAALESVGKVTQTGESLLAQPELDLDVLLTSAPKLTVTGQPPTAPVEVDQESAPKLGTSVPLTNQEAPATTFDFKSDKLFKGEIDKIRKKGKTLQYELEILAKRVPNPKVSRYLAKVTEILAGDDDALFNNSRILDQIASGMGPFRFASESRNKYELQEAETEQRKISNEARRIRDGYDNYRVQITEAVEKFPDLRMAGQNFERLLSGSLSLSDLDLPNYDTMTVQPEWTNFERLRNANQAALNHQHGHRLFIHTSAMGDFDNETATIDQRLINFNTGRPNPIRNTLAFHERLAKVHTYNENVIYTWFDNNLYLHGIVLFHLDKKMSLGQQTKAEEMEDRGLNRNNFREYRYNATTGKYSPI